MESQDQAIDKLLDLLYGWVPYTPAFKMEITQLMKFQSANAKQLLYPYGSHVTSAWFSYDCWAAQYERVSDGLEEVVKLHRPGDIFTDLNSFFRGNQATSKTIILEGSSLLQLTRSAYQQLKQYPETAELLQHYMLLQTDHEAWRLHLMSLSDRDKIKQFASKYPIHKLPASIAASYLRISPSRFSSLRGNYNKSS
ncbi:MAG: hypothetical protein EOO88_15110 [Pedobacter sp.]|nr:MAG: hypothetical protein EOO88_15110 [Pedobacter sp.]